MAESKMVSRAEMHSYMNTATTDSPSYALIGEGFTSLSESKNPKEYTRQYVHEKTERTDIVGYSPSIAYSVDTYTENAVIARVREIADKELIGTDAQVDIVTVHLFEPATGSGYKAYRRRYAIIPDAKGDGTEALIYSGTFKAVSDIEEGTFDEETKTFTPAE